MKISKEEYETLVSTKMLLIQANETIQEQRRIIDRLIPFERPLGNWIVYDVVHCLQYCSECRSSYDYKWNFCPNCGADMRGENNEH